MGRTPDTEFNLADQETAGADAVTNTKNGAETYSRLLGFNGTTWDRVRTGLSAVVSSVVGYLNILPFGKYNATAPTLTDGQFVLDQMDVNGNKKVTQATLQAGEDLTNDVTKVEQRFTGSGVLTSDTAVKSGAGFVHTITISQNDAAPTAGTIDVYDNTAASGTKLFTWTLTTAVFPPFSVILDQSFTTGLYVDFTTTADVAVSVSYR